MTLGKRLEIIIYYFIAFPTQTVEIGWEYKKRVWNCSKLCDKWTTYDGRLWPEQIAMDHLRNSDDFELLSTFLAITFFLKKCFTVQVANLWGIISLCVYLFFKLWRFTVLLQDPAFNTAHLLYILHMFILWYFMKYFLSFISFKCTSELSLVQRLIYNV